MKDTLEQWKCHWEKTVLVAAIFLSVLLLATLFFGKEETGDVLANGKGTSSQGNLLAAEAFVFLDFHGGFREPERNPFQTLLLPEVSPRPVPVMKPKPAPVPRKPVPPKVEVPVAKPVLAPAPVPEKPKPMAGKLTFAYQNLNQAGKAVAILTFERMGRNAETRPFGVGEEFLEVKVLAISEEALLVQDAAGKRYKIPLGESQNLWVSQK